MPKHEEQRKFKYTAEQLFDLVLDIGKYPEFIPWCLAARINEQDDTHINADLLVGYQFFREKFRSRVSFVRPYEIEVDYEHGPMQHLVNRWKFMNLEEGGCLVDFYVDFEFKSPLFKKIMNQFFDKSVVKMIDAFDQRAKDLYD